MTAQTHISFLQGRLSELKKYILGGCYSDGGSIALCKDQPSVGSFYLQGVRLSVFLRDTPVMGEGLG